MVFVIFIGLGIVAFVAALLWRGKISRRHNAFRAKMEEAADLDHARRLHQQHLRKNNHNSNNNNNWGKQND